MRGTRGEAAAIQQLVPDARVLTDDAATETALKQVRAPRILHVATHGFFLEDLRGATVPENPLLRSGLVFAGANQLRSDADDGILTALEATGLDLVGTQLVVLSACETGVGTVQNGEGVYGLRRALLLAGAQSLVVSLWKVEDGATRDLMVAFYRHVLAGEGRAAALRKAQLELRSRPATRHPFFWAGFIAVGDWRPLDASPAPSR